MTENEKYEFKSEYTENIYKEVVAFLNSNGGTIYVGYSDNGELIGIENAKKVEEMISIGIKTKILPEASLFVKVNLEKIEDKEYICINVNKGLDIYYLKEKGITKGTYIRLGSTSSPVNDETLKQMIIEKHGLSFEKSFSLNQNLTFNYIKETFLDNNIDLNGKNMMKNLKMIEDDKYTNLALLLSDQNPFTIKLAVYPDKNKLLFLDRKEFSGSIFEIYDNIVKYFKMFTNTYGIISESSRNDIEEFPEFVIREIVLNSICHRDYNSLTSNIINYYKNESIEVISYGPLYNNVTLEDVINGLSVTRNPNLQSIFMRINEVEAIGSGLRRINSFYNKLNLPFIVKALPSSFIVNVPSISINNTLISNPEDLILSYIKENGSIKRIEAQRLINKEKTTTSTILSKLVKDKIIKKIGNGPSTIYII